jgi:hypothetical protein
MGMSPYVAAPSSLMAKPWWLSKSNPAVRKSLLTLLFYTLHDTVGLLLNSSTP